jgi:hypothetical protein
LLSFGFQLAPFIETKQNARCCFDLARLPKFHPFSRSRERSLAGSDFSPLGIIREVNKEHTHANGFFHLDLQVDGLEHGFDLGWKLLPATDGPPEHEGEPYVQLTVSFAMTTGAQRREGHLDYALSRSFWKEQRPPTSTDADGETLRGLVLQRLRDDLRVIDTGGDPEPLRAEGKRPKFLRP